MAPVVTRIVVVLAVVLLLSSLPAGAQDVGDACPDLEPGKGATIEPSPCVPTGETFTVQLVGFAPGQLVSVTLTGASGPVGGGDHALRLGPEGHLDVDPRDFRGQAVPPGSYRIWIKDIGGQVPPAFTDVRIGEGATAAVGAPPVPTSAFAPTLSPTLATVPTAVLIAPTPDGTPEGTPDSTGGLRCDTSYPDFCIPPPPPDLNCADVAPNTNFTALPPDPHQFDSDGNGIGCEQDDT